MPAVQSRIPFGSDWHVFEHEGRKVFFSVDRSRVIEITDEPLFDLLREHEQAPDRDACDLAQRLERRHWPQTVKQETRHALVQLAPYTVRSPGTRPYVPRLPEDLSADDIKMSAITLVVAGACNLRCRYCYTGLQVEKHAYALMSGEVARQAVDLMVRHLSPQAPNLRATFFGGEPLLNFPVVQSTIEYIKGRARDLGRNYSFSLTTNGVLLTEPIVRYLHQNHCAILVSIDGPAEVHDRYRVFPDGQGTHRIVLEKLRMLRRLTGQAYVRATQTPQGPTVRQLCNYFMSLGATPPIVIGATMFTQDNNLDGALGSREEITRRITREYDEIRPLVYADLMAGRTPPQDCLTDRFKRLNCTKPLEYHYHCTACTSSTAVGPDGTLYPCHRYWPMRQYALGTARDGYDLPRYVQLLRKYHQVVTSSCVGCWARFLCLGLCSRFRATEDGGFAAPHSLECDAVKHSWEQNIGYFLKAYHEDPERLRQLCGSKSAAEIPAAGEPVGGGTPVAVP